MKTIELLSIVEEKLAYLIFGAVLIAAIYGLKTYVSQFSVFFPSGIYRYAATAFIIGVICVWMLIRFKPTVAMFLLLLLLPLGARLSEFFTIIIGDFIITADFIAIWIAALITIRVHGLRRDKFFILFALFILLVMVSSLVNNDSNAPSIILFGIGTPFLVYGLIESIIKNMQGLKFIVRALGFVVIFCSLFAFTQPFISGDVVDFFYLRLPSVFYNPIIFAGVILLLWPFTLIFEPFGSNRLPKLTFVFRVIGAGISLVALLLTGSRGAVVIGGLQIIWLLCKFKAANQHNARRIRYASYLILFGIFIVVIMNVDFLLDTVLRRFAQIDFTERGNSASERVLGALGGLELGFNNLFFGVGLGNFKYAYPFTSAASSGMYELESAHNFILNLFAEVGLIGVTLWLLVIASSFKRLNIAKKWLYEKHEEALHTVLMISLFGLTANQFLFYGEFLHKNVGLPMILYFVVLALISSLYYMQRERSTRA
jgi:O-Antigen ligase